MCNSAPTPPTPPDPTQVAAAQTQSNLQTATANAELNRVPTSTPYGNLNYQITGYNPDGTPQYASSVTLSPEEQQLYNSSTAGQIALGKTGLGMLQGVNGLETPYSSSGLPGIASTAVNGAGSPGAIQDAENAAYNTQAQYFKPQQAEQTEQTKDQLANQGLAPGSEAYEHAMGDLTRQQTFQSQAAQNAAVTAGQQEQATLYGQGVQGANLQNTANAQELGQQLQLRELPLNEYDALASGSQVQQPNFPNTPNATMNPTDISGDIYNSYQGQLNTYASQVGAQNSMTAGLFGLGAAGVKGLFGSPTAMAALGLSDERAKKNIEHIGSTPGGHKVYSFDYKKEFEPFGFGGHGRKQVGVLAQEVEKKQPEAVHRSGPGGMRVVDYRRVA